MTRKEKYFLFVALQQILQCLKYKPILYYDEETSRKYNEELDDVINFLEELKGKVHE